MWGDLHRDLGLPGAILQNPKTPIFVDRHSLSFWLPLAKGIDNGS